MGVNYYLKRRSDGSLFDLGKRGKPRSWDSGCSPSTPGRWFKFSSIDEIELALLDSDDGGYMDLFGYTREDISIVALMIWSFGNGSEVRVVYDLDDHVLRETRDYLYLLVESESPPIHPLLGAAIGSLVAASESGDLAAMSNEESDVVDAILDFASRGDLHRIARAIAVLTRPEVQDPR